MPLSGTSRNFQYRLCGHNTGHFARIPSLCCTSQVSAYCIFAFICLKILSDFPFDFFLDPLVGQECVASFSCFGEFFSFLPITDFSFHGSWWEKILDMISGFFC